jgi:hypothetical protein
MEWQTHPTIDRISSTGEAPTPSWWTAQHTSAWDRVKDAFQRDFEQTKADFSSTGGHELNQDAGDTLMQAFGSQPVPPMGVKTHADDPKEAARRAAKEVERIGKANVKEAQTTAKANTERAEKQADLLGKVSDARKDLADQEIKTRAKIAQAEDGAVQVIEKERAKVDEATTKRDEAVANWRHVELEARYGYGARTQYPSSEWNVGFESKLSSEWDRLGAGRTWAEARPGVRRGWDFAGQKH